VPVPILVTPHGWDPTTEPFADWLAALLERDYALLQAPEYGRDVALRLIKGGYLAVILDGLDEMPETLRPIALRSLDEQAVFRLVLLTRSEELKVAVRGAHLRRAAALELQPIDSVQAAKYLANCQIDPLPDPWQRLIDHLMEHTDGILARTLNTPLTLALVRDTYGPWEKVDELIDVDGQRFGDREAIEDHLRDRMLTAAYTQRPGQLAPPYTVQQARQWLGQLARRMKEEGTPDLKWWQVPYWVPAWPRVLVTVVIMSLVSALLFESLSRLAVHMNLFPVFHVGSRTALTAVFAKTLGYAFMFGTGLLISPSFSTKSAQEQGQPQWNKIDILIILFLGLGVGVGFGLEVGLVGGLVSSIVVGLGFVLSGGPAQKLGWLQWSRTDTRTNLLTGLVVGLVAGLVAGLGYGLRYGFQFGLVYGTIAGVGYMLVIVVGGLSSQRRSRFRWSAGDTARTLLIGFVIATVSTAGYGTLYVLITILSGNPPRLWNQFRRRGTTTPTTLFTVLMAGLGLGFLYILTYGLALNVGLGLGLVFGIMLGLLLGLRQPSTEASSPLDPLSVWRRERQFGLGLGLIVGLMYGLMGGLVDGLVDGPVVGLVFGLLGGIVVGLGSGLVSSATWATALASTQLWHRGKAPICLLRFLEDARERQILRTVGPVYQFRDTWLQERLADACDASQESVSHTHGDQMPLTS
jgi:hypothetical protein